MFNWAGYQKRAMNEKEYEYEMRKQFADRYAEAKIIARQEKDPVKQEKMYMRLAMGATDFSDL